MGHRKFNQFPLVNLLPSRRAMFALAALTLLAVFCERLDGQEPEAGHRQERNFTLSLDVQLVALNVTVLDRKGSFVPGLTKENFQVFENRQPQEIQLFYNEDVPLTIGLVVDSSGSMRDRRREVVSAALAFVEASKPEDEMFVVNFNEEVQLGLAPDQPFSSNVAQLREALSRLVVRGQTSLYDALWMALEHLNKGRHDKKALVVSATVPTTPASTVFEKLWQPHSDLKQPSILSGFMNRAARTAIPSH